MARACSAARRQLEEISQRGLSVNGQRPGSATPGVLCSKAPLVRDYCYYTHGPYVDRLQREVLLGLEELQVTAVDLPSPLPLLSLAADQRVPPSLRDGRRE